MNSTKSITDLRPIPDHDRAGRWKLRTRELTFGKRPLLMGIVNVTPDSFSDGGKCFDIQAAVEHALRLESEGADILDIGGESTRPYAAPVLESEELRRIAPVVAAVCQRTRVPVSIDTSHAAVARHAVSAGAEIINDVTGLEGDPEMVGLAAGSGAGVCAMHMQGSPQTMQINPQYRNVVVDIEEYLGRRRDALLAAGIEQARICLDPGIGFGKSHQHNLTLLANCHRFHALGCPLLVGHSRKGFIEKVGRDSGLGESGSDRLAGTIGVSISLAMQGVQILRVHDVAPVRQALLLFEATGGLDGQEMRLPPPS